MAEPKAFVHYRDPSFHEDPYPGEYRAPFSSVDEAVAQVTQDLKEGRDVARVEDAKGNVIHTKAALRKLAKDG